MSFPKSIYDEDPEDMTEGQIEVGSNDILQSNACQAIVIGDDDEKENHKGTKSDAREPITMEGRVIGHKVRQCNGIPVSKSPVRSPSVLSSPENEDFFYIPSATKNKRATKKRMSRLNTCEHCGEKFKNIPSYEKHLKSQHKDSKLLTCPICDKRLASFQKLAAHKARHNQQTYKCEHCDFATGFYRRFQGHVNYHRKNPIFIPKCFQCGLASFNLEWVETHGKQRHCKKCIVNGVFTLFTCQKKYSDHLWTCKGRGLTGADVNLVHDDVILVKEEKYEDNNIEESQPLRHEASLEAFRSEVKRPEAKRRRINDFKTFGIPSA